MTEVDSFIFKFRNLWKTFHSATLNIQSESGKASYSLNLVVEDRSKPLVTPCWKSSVLGNACDSEEVRKLRIPYVRTEAKN